MTDVRHPDRVDVRTVAIKFGKLVTMPVGAGGLLDRVAVRRLVLRRFEGLDRSKLRPAGGRIHRTSEQHGQQQKQCC